MTIHFSTNKCTIYVSQLTNSAEWRTMCKVGRIDNDKEVESRLMVSSVYIYLILYDLQ